MDFPFLLRYIFSIMVFKVFKLLLKLKSVIKSVPEKKLKDIQLLLS